MHVLVHVRILCYIFVSFRQIAPNFRCKFKLQSKSCLPYKIYINLFQSRVNRHVCDVINFMINVILSYLLVM